MSWEAIGATGEWAGAAAVVASLIYLATQVRHSNRQTQAAARYSFLDAYGQMSASLVENKAASAVFRRGLSGEGLDADEEMQFFLILGQWLNTWSVMYELHTEGQLPDGQWFIVRNDIHSSLSTIGGREYWDRVGKAGVQPGFSVMVEALLNSEERPNDWLAPRNL